MKKNSPIVLIYEDNQMTQMMRKLGLFESNKFAAVMKDTSADLDENLSLAASINDTEFTINPGYLGMRMSDGKKFCDLEKYCKYVVENR